MKKALLSISLFLLAAALIFNPWGIFDELSNRLVIATVVCIIGWLPLLYLILSRNQITGNLIKQTAILEVKKLNLNHCEMSLNNKRKFKKSITVHNTKKRKMFLRALEEIGGVEKVSVLDPGTILIKKGRFNNWDEIISNVQTIMFNHSNLILQ